VLAPAGAGKTRVLAARLRHLVHDRGVQPELITALAYNTRAAKAIRPARPAPHADSAGGAAALEIIEQSGTALSVRLRALLDTNPPSSVAVLARVGAALLAPQVALVAAGVPVHRHVGPEALDRPGLRTALAYLRIAARPDRITPQDLADTLRRPARRLTGVIDPSSATSLARLARHAVSVDTEHRAALHRLVDDLAHLAGLIGDGADSRTLVAAIRDRIGLGASLDAIDRVRVRPEGSSHGDDLEALAELAALEPDPTLLPRWLADRLRDGGASNGPAGDVPGGGVTLSTVHRVKGREWDVVVLVGLRAGLIPHRLCDDVEEERRVLHVAITRARRHLLLVTDPTRPSPFLPELMGTLRPVGAPAPDEAQLRTALHAWRRARAAADDVPAFLVAHDRTLDDLARRRPRDRIALRACHGIGPSKLTRYGDELLALIDAPTTTPRLHPVTGPSKAQRGR
jgi:DNA helicase-2/ATP-dependent DNA helicase PcrA